MNTDILLQNGGYTAYINSTDGAVCYRLRSESLGAELLRTPESEEHLDTNRFLFGNPILFPPNRIHTGTFTFEGREYRFPINELETGCHIHGDLHKLPFAVEQFGAGEVKCTADFACGEYLGFPHAFSVERAYTLTDRGLHEKTAVRNRSAHTMPVMLAFHTTFRIPLTEDGKPEDYRLKLPVNRLHKRDKNYLPTCEYENGELCDALREGRYIPSDYAASAFFSASGDTVELWDESRRIKLRYQTRGFGYWLIYNGGNRDFLCVEPQTCAVDAFHIDLTPEQAGVISLAAGDEVLFETQLSVEKF